MSNWLRGRESKWRRATSIDCSISWPSSPGRTAIDGADAAPIATVNSESGRRRNKSIVLQSVFTLRLFRTATRVGRALLKMTGRSVEKKQGENVKGSGGLGSKRKRSRSFPAYLFLCQNRMTDSTDRHDATHRPIPMQK